MSLASLLHFDGANGSTVFTDETGKSWTRYGNAQISTTQAKFGGASGYFDGTGDYLQTVSSEDFNFGTGDFTISLWFYWSVRSGLHSIISNNLASFAAGAVTIVANTDKRIEFALYGVGSILTASGSINTGAWTHLEVSRSAGVLNIFINGALSKTSALTAAVNFGVSGTLIGWARYNTYFNGYIDDLVVLKGEALHTAAFTPPTAPYSSIVNGVAELPITVTVRGVGQPSLPVLVHVGELGTSSLPVAVSVLPASIIAGAESVCIGAGDAAVWTPVVTLAGTDITNRTLGTIRVEAEEGAARIAELTLRPAPGTALNLAAWTGLPLTIDVADNALGTPRWPVRLFTGVVDTPAIDLANMTLTLSATDDLQGVCDGMTQAALAALIGGHHSAAVFDAAAGGWDYANDRLSTLPAALDISPLGALRLTPWTPKETADIVLDGLIGDGSLAVSLAQRAALVNEVHITFGYRFPRVKAELHALDWAPMNMSGFAQYILDGKYIPQRAAIEAAIGKAGGSIESITYTPLPDEIIAVGSGYWSPGPNDAELCMGVAAGVSFDYAASVEEQHEIRVYAPRSIEAVGVRRETMSGALEGVYPDIVATETGIKLYKDQVTSIPPADVATPVLEKTTSAEVTLTPETNRAAANNAMETLISIAKTRIWASHRGNSVSLTVPLMPAIDLDKTVALNDSGVAAKGKVRRVVHAMDTDSGAATSEVTLALCSVAGVGIVHDDSTTTAPAGTTAGQSNITTAPSVVFNNGEAEDHTITITFPAVEAAERNGSAVVLPSSYAAPLVEDLFTITI